MKKPQIITSIALLIIGLSLNAISPPGQYCSGFVYGFIKGFYGGI